MLQKKIWEFFNKYDINGLISTTSTNNITNEKSHKLIKIIDLLGRETNYKSNTPLFYIYDNGTVDKRIITE